MKRPFLYLSLPIIVLISVVSSAVAQTTPQVEVVMNPAAAQQNDVIYADVYVRSDDPIIGADIGIEVNSDCLRIEGRENGRYLPTSAEENGFVPFDELTETGTRLAANVLGQDIVADPTQYFFRASIRVLCDTGDAEVNVSFAQLVKPDLESYKLAEQQIMTTSGIVTMSPGQAAVATAAPLPTRTATAPIMVPTQPSEQNDTGDDTGGNPLIVIAGLVLVVIILAAVVVVLRQRK
jgi:hypothetical protein